VHFELVEEALVELQGVEVFLEDVHGVEVAFEEVQRLEVVLRQLVDDDFVKVELGVEHEVLVQVVAGVQVQVLQLVVTTGLPAVVMR